MANFKRRLPRARTRSHYSPRARQTYWLGTWPAAWDVLYHRRPQRRRTRAIEKAILRGGMDPDSATWPLGNRKPHQYYW